MTSGTERFLADEQATAGAGGCLEDGAWPTTQSEAEVIFDVLGWSCGRIVIPATLLLIFLLLYFNFGNLVAPVVVMLSVPFALIGGFWLVWWLNFNLSVAVAVGFIALAGVAAEIGVLVLTFIDQEVAQQCEAGGGRLTADGLRAAVQSGVAKRVRPIAMTATAVIAGLVPILLGSGTGSDVMRRIAAPMVGGMVTTTLLSLIALPVIYSMILQMRERKHTKEKTE